MELTNYWWLLIWIAVGGFVISVLFPARYELVLGKVEKRWRIPAAVLLALPYVVWAGNRGDDFGDTGSYRMIFYKIPDSFDKLLIYLSDNSKDKGFSVLVSVIKKFIGNDDTMFFLVIAAFQMICIACFFRKYSKSFLLCMFMFIASTDYLSWMFNGMRQFTAVCITLLSFGLIVKKKYVPAIGLILLASTIHGTAIIMLPIILVVQGKAWNKRTLTMLLCIVVVILFMDRFTGVLDSMLADTQYNDLVTNEIWAEDDGTNMFRVLFYSIPAFLSLYGKRYVDTSDSPVINMCVNCAACTSFLYILSAFSSGIYIGRLPIYTTLQGYVAVPWLIDHMFAKSSAILVKLALICGFFAFFYYQMHIAWEIL